jgi:hypothetical protein
MRWVAVLVAVAACGGEAETLAGEWTGTARTIIECPGLAPQNSATGLVRPRAISVVDGSLSLSGGGCEPIATVGENGDWFEVVPRECPASRVWSEFRVEGGHVRPTGEDRAEVEIRGFGALRREGSPEPIQDCAYRRVEWLERVR